MGAPSAQYQQLIAPVGCWAADQSGRLSIAEPKVSPPVRIVLLVIIALLALVFVWLNVLFLRHDNVTDGGAGQTSPDWREVLSWDFAKGEHPDGWGWGQRSSGAGFLELKSSADQAAVYIISAEHASDFVLSAEVMLWGSGSDDEARVHLMTRDNGGANHLCGVVLTAGSDTMSVHHKVNLYDHLQDLVPTTVRIESQRWHRLRLTCARGAVTINVDGQEVYHADGPFPPGLYSEPYVAVEGGRVRLRHFQLLEATAVGGERTGGGHEH